MQTFLDEVAAHIFSNYSSDLGRIAVVLPNRRAGLFLKKNLAKLAGKTIWAPSIFSVEDFITELSGYNIIDPVFLQLELYEVHRKVEGASAQGFEEFLKWGGVLLADFNEVDMYLADHRDLFNYLTDAKAIALWNPEHTKLTDFEIRYLRFYQSLDSYYKELRNRLEFKKQVYQGLAYRIVSEKLDKLLETLPWVKIIFAGFNALTAAEEKIMMYLQNAGRADVIWDSDEYYLNDPMQEAGTFLRQNLKTIKPIEFNATINNFESKEKQITVLGVPKNIGQVKITGQLLDALLASNKNAGSIAIVLNNERLMVPLLNSIPDSVQEFNLTMGLSLKDTPLFRLIDAAFNLQQNILNFSKGNPGNLRIYHRDILRLLEHPYIRLMFEHVEPNIQAVIDEIKNSNRVFFKPENLLKDYFQQTKDEINTLHCLFNPWNNNASNAIQSLVNVLKDLKIFFIKRNADAGNLLPELLLEIEYV
ncbi:MAG: hypothetical protein JW731_04820, partial [Bacteroidales bacterium]|nr:hypothetical protein [Bacteroidales bacterium]